MSNKSIVSIIRCEDYSQDRVSTAVTEALRFAELEPLFAAQKSVLIKPNLLSSRKPEEAVTTHPAVIEAAAKIALDRGCGVRVGDSPPFAGENKDKYARLCEMTGTGDVSRRLDVPLVRFEEDVVTKQHPQGKFYKSFEIARVVDEADIVVNLPKLKTHGLTMFSGAVKNIFGCIPGIRKGLFHVQAAEDREVFAQMLVDLLSVVRPAINVMDAVVAMEGEGPNAGAPKQIGLIMASSDPVALDAVACALVGIEPLSIFTTQLAAEQGIGCADLSNIEIRGEALDSVRIGDFKLSSGKNDWARIPAPIRKLLRGQLVSAPRINSRECAGCGDCATACPVNAITRTKPPAIDLTKCIRCYCCHEVCNFSAISLKRGWLGDLFLRGREKN